jgi:hypothetical protein
MTISLCVVSGTLVAPDGSPLPGVQVQFLPAPVAVRSGAARLLAPRPVAASTDAEAGLSVGLVPGIYSVRTREPGGREYDPYLVEVPERETAELTEIMRNLPAPQSVYDAAASARVAASAAGRAEAVAAGLASGSGGTMFASRAECEAADMPEGAETWSVRQDGLLLVYGRDPEGTAIETANGVRGAPLGPVRPEHWGAAPGVECGTAIQAAIDWLEARGGGELLFAPRRYPIASTIRVKRNVWLKGEGWRFQGDYTNDALIEGSWIELLPGSHCDGVLFRAEPAAGETARQRLHAGMRDLGVFGRRSDNFAPSARDLNATGRGIRLEGASYITLENVCAFRCAEAGISMGSYDFGGSIGTLSCNNVMMDRVTAVCNGGVGIQVAGGDGIYSNLNAGYNGSTGISAGDGPLTGCIAWDNFGHGISINGTFPLVGCRAYDNRWSGFLVLSQNVTLSGCLALSNGVTDEGDPLRAAGIALSATADKITISGCTTTNRNGTAGTQKRGIYSAGSAAKVTLGANDTAGNATSDVFFLDYAGVKMHTPGLPWTVRHPGFRAEERIDMDGHSIYRAVGMTFSGWVWRSSAPGGVLAAGANTLVSASITGGATITGLTGDTAYGVPFMIVRNLAAAPLVFQHNIAKLRLHGASDKVLAQNEAIMFVHVSGEAWQQVGGLS